MNEVERPTGSSIDLSGHLGDDPMTSRNRPVTSLTRQMTHVNVEVSVGTAPETCGIGSMTSEIDPGTDENGSMTTVPSTVPEVTLEGNEVPGSGSEVKRQVPHENDRGTQEKGEETEEIEQEIEVIEQVPEENEQETNETIEDTEEIEEVLTESEHQP